MILGRRACHGAMSVVLDLSRAFAPGIRLVALQALPQYLVELVRGHSVGFGKVETLSRLGPILSVVLWLDHLSGRVAHAERGDQRRRVRALQYCRRFGRE